MGDSSTDLARQASLRARLIARIRRRGLEIVTATHAIGALRLSFTRIADPDVVLDQIVQEQDRRERATGERMTGNELHLPYWAELWDSAFGIAHALGPLLGAHPRADATAVLDLGCGMGFTGMVAAALGASVLFADLEPDALLFARLNTIPWRDRVRTRRLNWQTDRLDERFDWILGADVLYDRQQWDHLDRFFREHVAPRGSVLLGEPGRHTSDNFPAWIVDRGWRLEVLHQSITTRPAPIRIFRLKLDRAQK